MDDIPENIKKQYNDIKNQIIDINQPPIILNGVSTYGKFIPFLYIYAYEINILPVTIPVKDMKIYYFLELKGVNTLKNDEKGDDQEYINAYILLNDNNYSKIWYDVDLNVYADVNDNYVARMRERFKDAPISKIDFNSNLEKEEQSNASCLITKVNITRNIGEVSDIGVRNDCNLPYTKNFSKLSGIFLLRFLLLKQLNFKGPVFVADSAKKDGKHVSFFYMKKYNDPKYLLNNGFSKEGFIKYSKYQDYGFEIIDDDAFEKSYEERLLRLIYIKMQCATLDIDNYKYLEDTYWIELHELLGLLKNNNYEKNLQELLMQYMKDDNEVKSEIINKGVYNKRKIS